MGPTSTTTAATTIVNSHSLITLISSKVDPMREFQGGKGRARRKAREDQGEVKELGGTN